MKIPADIVVYDKFQQILLLAEVKTPEQSTPEWAAEVRQDIVESMEGFRPKYFLVVSRDHTYVWLTAAEGQAAPDETLQTDQLFSTYFPDGSTSATSISGNTLELIVGLWLRDLTRGDLRALSVLPEGLDLIPAVKDGLMQFADAA
jgi:hypothetical protein